jgi:hypothetical protein
MILAGVVAPESVAPEHPVISLEHDRHRPDHPDLVAAPERR